MRNLIIVIAMLISLSTVAQFNLLQDFASSGDPGQSDKNNVFVFDNYMYYGVGNYLFNSNTYARLYRTDGNSVESVSLSSGTPYMLKNNIKFLQNNGNPSKLSFLAVNNQTNQVKLNFMVSTGTNSPFNVELNSESSPGVIATLNEDFYYVDNNQITRYSNSSSTTLTTQMNGNGFQNFRSMFGFNGKLYVTAENINSGFGIELYEYDVNSQSFSMFSDIANGAPSGDPDNFFEANGKLYFTAKAGDSSTPYTLYVFNPSNNSVNAITNTETPKDIVLYNVGSNTFIMLSALINGTRRLIRVLTTTDSSFVMSTNISEPEDITVFNGFIYFGATGINGKELYKASQIPNSEILVSDINTSGNSNPRNFLEHKGDLYFRADDGTNGQELWKVDSSDNTTMIQNFVSFGGDFAPIPLASLNDRLLMSGIVESSGQRELFTLSDFTSFTQAVSSVWNNSSNWTNGVPDAATIAVIPSGKNAVIGNYSSNIYNTNANCLDLSIQGNLRIEAGSALTINGNITEVSLPIGLTISSEYNTNTALNKTGSLLLLGSQSGDFITFERSVRGESSGNNHNWSLISFGLREVNRGSLINANNFATGTGGNISFAYYDVNQANSGSGWVYYNASSTGTINSARGFSYSSGSTNNTDKITYSGKLRFTDQTFTTSFGLKNWNLLGNPFMSFMPINSVANSTNNLLLENDIIFETGFKALYIWDSTLNSGNGGYKIINQSSTLNESFLAPGQGFFINTKTQSFSFNFPRSLRTHQNNTVFNKSSQTKINLKITQDKIENSTEIKYLDNTTGELDEGFDAAIFDSETQNLSIYSGLPENNQNLRLALQCVSKDYENTVIPIGLKTHANKEYTISSSVVNLPAGINVILEDKLQNSFTNISNSNYKFTPIDAIDGTGRFFLHTTNYALTVNDNFTEKVSVYQKNRNLIFSGIEDSFNIKIYNTLGQIVFSKEKIKNKQLQLPNSIISGLYIIHIKSTSIFNSKKIIVNK